MKAIIDGDVPVFTECASAERRGNPFGQYFVDVDEVARSTIDVVNTWAEKAGATDGIIFVYSHPSRRNYRKTHILPEQYKASRAVKKPDGYYEVLDILINTFDSFAIEGVEGDDTCGILHSSDAVGPTVNISTDKDFRTIPGTLFNPMKMEWAEEISVNEAHHYRMLQTLTGDSADGYKGCPKIGPVKADKILDSFNIPKDDEADPKIYELTLWDKVEEAYFAAYPDLPSDEVRSLAVTQMRCARILHRCDYDKDGNRIRLWHPTAHDWLQL